MSAADRSIAAAELDGKAAEPPSQSQLPARKTAGEAAAKAAKSRRKSKGDDDSQGQTIVSEKESMCTAILSVPLDAPPLLMQELAETAAAKSFIRYTQGEHGVGCDMRLKHF